MNAAVVRDFAQGPRYDSFELPVRDGELVVEVLAAALSPRVRSGASGAHYTSRGTLPLIPGLDAVARLPDGRRAYVIAAHDELGTMAERAIAEPRLSVALPDGVAAPTIAAGMLPAISSWVALTKRAPLAPGASVLVLGATGTSGQLAVQIAKLLGATTVIAAGRDADALAGLRALGADHVLPLDADAIATAASEVDIVLDYLWGSVTSAVMPAVCRRRAAESRALHWVLIGSVAGDDVALSSVLLRKRNLHVLGSGQGATSTAEMFSVAPDIVAAFAAGKLAVRAREVPLAEVATWWSARVPSGERLVFVP